MPRITSYHAQLELAEELKKYLNGLQERLDVVIRHFEQEAGKLYDAGMMDETFNDFVNNYMNETNNKIRSVIDIVNGRDIPFVDDYIGRLEELIARYGNA